MQNIRTMTLVAFSLAAAASAQAALVDRGGGLIYDTTRNITWLADMNYAKTSGYDADGLMNWNQAVAWASNLVYGGFDDWRLPTIDPLDTSCNADDFYCTGGELSGLFVTEFGNKGGESVLNQAGDTPTQVANLALFTDMQPYFYWSGTVSESNPGEAWFFNASYGRQRGTLQKYLQFYAVAVRDGDVAATAAVPEPQTLTLALAALGAALYVRRRA